MRASESPIGRMSDRVRGKTTKETRTSERGRRLRLRRRRRFALDGGDGNCDDKMTAKKREAERRTCHRFPGWEIAAALRHSICNRSIRSHFAVVVRSLSARSPSHTRSLNWISPPPPSKAGGGPGDLVHPSSNLRKWPGSFNNFFPLVLDRFSLPSFFLPSYVLPSCDENEAKPRPLRPVGSRRLFSFPLFVLRT